MITGNGLKKNILIVTIVIVSACLSGCGREKAEQESLKRQNRQLKTQLERIKTQPALTPAQLLAQANIHRGNKEYDKAIALLQVITDRFPSSVEAGEAQTLLADIKLAQDQDKQPEKGWTRIFPFLSDSEGYMTVIAGAGGQADGASISAELDRVKGLWLYGAGLTWMRTTEVDDIYYVNQPSGSTGVTNLGDYNEGDEYELYLVAGRKVKENIIAAATLGLSRQEIVNLEQSNTTNTLYVTSRKTDQYVTISGQVRYTTKNNLLFIIGYHTRRGVLGGVSLKW